MTIAKAIQDGEEVRVYDEKGRLLFSRPGTVHKFGPSTVDVRFGSSIWTYDEYGRPCFSRPADNAAMP